MQWWPAGFALFAAALLPVQAALNGALNRALDRPALVALISMAGSAVFVVTVGLATGRLGLVPADRVANVPWWAWPAGVCGAVYLVSQPLVAHRLGAALYISIAVAGQIAAAMLLDHFGALDMPRHAATPMRLLGAALIAAGVVLVARF